jgi:hypothetical protein
MEFVIAHRVARPILQWLRLHPDMPARALTHELNRIPENASEQWKAICEALSNAEPLPFLPDSCG